MSEDWGKDTLLICKDCEFVMANCRCGQDSLHHELRFRIADLEAENARMRTFIQNTANEDYRGHRSAAAVNAFNLLRELDKERE